MFVYIVLGRILDRDPYIVAVFKTEQHAQVHASRWMSMHAGGVADVLRFSVME